MNLIIDGGKTPYLPEHWKINSHKNQGHTNSSEQFFQLVHFGRGYYKEKPAFTKEEGEAQGIFKWRLPVMNHVGNDGFRQMINDTENTLNANFLDFWLEHQELIPREFDGRAIFFFGTTYLDHRGCLAIRYLYQDNCKIWRSGFVYEMHNWDGWVWYWDDSQHFSEDWDGRLTAILFDINENKTREKAMTTIRPVDELPVLDQSLFPELEEGFTGLYRVMDCKKYQSAEEEAIIAAVMTAASRHGKWEPILLIEELLNILASDRFSIGVLQMLDGPDHFEEHLHKVINAGDLELVKIGNNIYIVPLPAITDSIKMAKVGKKLTDVNVTTKV